MHNFKLRKESSIINIRKFHNWIKRELINESCEYLKENYNKSEIWLLDLSCGKGGDIIKFYDNGITRVIGFDIDKKSIDEARKRFSNLIFQLKKNGVTKLPDYRFYTMDLSDKNNLEKIKLILKNSKFNIVNCQFAIHYFFKTDATLNTFMTIVSSYIDKDGFFIATTMNGNKIAELFKKNNIIKNDIFKIVNGTNNIISPYGNKYIVSLGKETDKEHYFAGKDSEEFLVYIGELKNVCDKFGLMFIGSTEFENWYNKFGNDILTKNEKEFSYLNFSFTFMPKRNIG
jgi:mRNA (guanine-N7-)-methyltransferase